MSSVKAGSRRRENKTGQRAERKDQAKAWSFYDKNIFFRNIKFLKKTEGLLRYTV